MRAPVLFRATAMRVVELMEADACEVPKVPAKRCVPRAPNRKCPVPEAVLMAMAVLVSVPRFVSPLSVARRVFAAAARPFRFIAVAATTDDLGPFGSNDIIALA